VPGALRYLEALGEPRDVQLVPTRDTLGLVGGLPVKINPHFGLRYPDGRAEAIRLHFDEEPPKADAIVANLHLLGRHMDQVLPHAEPVLVDLRRGATIRPDAATKPEEVERWLAGEAAAFAAMWSAA